MTAPDQPAAQSAAPGEPAAATSEPGEAIGSSGLTTATATVAALRRALAAGTLTSAELTACYLDRIERHNPQLRAVIAVSPDAAAQAAASDAAAAAGAPPGPLAGIPVLIKDNIAVDGTATTAGSPALLTSRPPEAFLAGRLRAAGAVLLGKANLSEWANFRSTQSSSGWSTLGGQTANPRGPGRNPSGSSSGSAAALAAGLAPLAVGTETDGSIVSPAAACGVVGIKPTLGLISRAGIVPVSAAQDTAGPMAVTVADAAVLLGALAGPDPGDPATAAAAGQPGDYTQFLDPGALDGARIGVWRDGCALAGAATMAVLDAAVAALRCCGATVTDPVALPGADKLAEPELAALLTEFRHDLNGYLAALPGDQPGTLRELIDFNIYNGSRVLAIFGQELFEQAEATGGDLSAASYLAARGDARRLAAGGLDAALTGSRLDAVVSLTGSPAWLTDHVLGDHHIFGTSGPAAVAGYPAISVPAGRVRGLPVGVSFTGPPWSEPRLIALAHAFELAGARHQAGRGQR